MNKERILKLAAAIEAQANPELGFHMGTFKNNASDLGIEHPCGTVACIAGWAAALYEPQIFHDADWMDAYCFDGIAAEALDIPISTDGDELFYMRGASIHYEDVTPAIAAAVLRHYAETGVVDWNKACVEVV